MIFQCGRDYTARDVIDGGYFRGELQRPWEELLRGVEAEREASASDLEADDDAIASCAEAFRYEHNLITAEETERWLAERALTIEDFSNYFVRAYWRKVLDENAKPAPIAFHSASPELRELLASELFFSGDFDRLTKEESWRVAARCATNGSALPGDLIDAERERFFIREQIDAVELPALLDQLERDPSWFAEMISLQAVYRRQCEILLSEAAPDKELAPLRIPLTRFELEIIEVKSRDAAAEAIFCVREDGMSMDEVATDNRYPYRRAAVFLEEIPDESQQKFLSAAPGDVLDPIVCDGGFQLCRVTTKSEPTLDDSVVRARVEARILQRHFSELVARHIEWKSMMPAS